MSRGRRRRSDCSTGGFLKSMDLGLGSGCDPSLGAIFLNFPDRPPSRSPMAQRRVVSPRLPSKDVQFRRDRPFYAAHAPRWPFADRTPRLRLGSLQGCPWSGWSSDARPVVHTRPAYICLDFPASTGKSCTCLPTRDVPQGITIRPSHRVRSRSMGR